MLSLFEYTLDQLLKIQKTAKKAFPQWDWRVKAVYPSVRLKRSFSDGLVFSVKSSRYAVNSVDYQVYLKFEGVLLTLRTLLKTGKYGESFDSLDWRRLGADFIKSVDIKVYSNDPAQLYWGFQYYATQKGVNYQFPVNIPPTRTISKRHSAIGSKFVDAVLRKLPLYNAYMGKFLRDKYGRYIREVLDEFFGS